MPTPTTPNESPHAPDTIICYPATMQPLGFAQFGDDDFQMLANLLRFADGTSPRMGVPYETPTDEDIRGAIVTANKVFERTGASRRIPVTDESVAAVRAHL